MRLWGPYFKLESTSPYERVTFAVLQARLIDLVNARIQNGDFTERGLARILGVSQPQVHNVLKGARKLRPEFADRLISILEITITDLLETAEMCDKLTARREASGAWAEAPHPIGADFDSNGWRNGAGSRKPPQAAAQSTSRKQQAVGKI